MKTKRFNDARFYVAERISPNISRTPEGYLLCKAVPIARTGVLLYGEKEIGLKGDADGIVKIYRDAETLFDEKTLASFEGKPVTLDHPPDFVAPENWKDYAKGTVQNVRRGEGADSEMMMADLLITDAGAISEVLDGLREVSNGYDADYEQVSPGVGRQMNIKGNHVALVENGRCGSRCKIGDKAMSDKKGFFKTILAALKTADEETVKEVMKEELKENSAPSIDGIEEWKAGLEAKVADLGAKIDGIIEKLNPKPATDEEIEIVENEEKTGDACNKDKESLLEEEKTEKEITQDTLARVAMLCPGMKVKGAVTKDSLPALKRKALETADSALTGHFGDLKKLSGRALDAAFIGASELARIKNNGTASFKQTKDAKPSNVIAQMQAKNVDFWKNRG